MAGRKRKRTRRRGGQLGHVTPKMIATAEDVIQVEANRERLYRKKGNQKMANMHQHHADGQVDLMGQFGKRCECATYSKLNKKICACGADHEKVMDKIYRKAKTEAGKQGKKIYM